jgi:hypothetical protein
LVTADGEHADGVPSLRMGVARIERTRLSLANGALRCGWLARSER